MATFNLTLENFATNLDDLGLLIEDLESVVPAPPLPPAGSFIKTSTGGGRNKFVLDVEATTFLRELGHNWDEIAGLSGVSRRTIETGKNDAIAKGLFVDPKAQTDIGQDELLELIVSIREEFPTYDVTMIESALQARGVRVQRERLWRTCKYLNPAAHFGVAARPARRTYSVPHPNYLIHIDGNHKLIRWKFVVHAAIDGFSRLVTYLQASTNNRADTVLNLFQTSVQMYGLPLHVRSDYGGENMEVYRYMIEQRGDNCGAHIFGKSTHNQRIERLNKDLNEKIFSRLEDSGWLDSESDLDMWVLHYIYLPRLNRSLSNFANHYNNHKIRTMGSRTPLQIFSRYTNQTQQPATPGMYEYAISQPLPADMISHVNVGPVICPLNEESLTVFERETDPMWGYVEVPDQLQEGADLLEARWGVTIFKKALGLAVELLGQQGNFGNNCS
ncbi:hypothetical protein HDU76_000710 [Blyttiomyces sp. JEL0837]|nr:hypothetical protein HDU76_000710 [Blyttiomyces sp. JEL0837]